MLNRLLRTFALWAPALAAAPTIDAAFERIYSFDFSRGRALAHDYARQNDRDPMGPAVLAAADLFAELGRLKLLTQEPGAGKMKGQPDPVIWKRIESATRDAESRAKAVLARSPNDAQALMALMVAHGVQRDYLALVDKSYRQSWVSARLAQQYALQLVYDRL
jgi:hypothetical protein